MKSLKSAIGISALAIATLVASAVAQDAPVKQHDHGMQFMATALDLTDAQVAQIKQIRTANKADFRTTHQQMKTLHEQLRAVITADTFDEAKAQSLIGQVQQLQASQMLEHARQMNAIYKVLNPAQKAKAEKLFGSMEFGGMHGHHGHGGPAGATAPPPTQD
ncbi:MAG TPA: Spy/CpxP family protein refolding chaperone [Candidatus Koribacter sp.]|jgi:protein CpxP